MTVLVVAQQPAPTTGVEKLFEQARKLDNMGGREENRQLGIVLAEIKKHKLSFDENDTWLRMSRDLAIRQADAKRLKELSKEESIFPQDMIYTVLLSYGKLTKGDLVGAEKLADSVDTAEINPREARRVYAIKARIAQMNGDLKTERKFIEKMIEHLPSWSSDHCQSCHDNGKFKGKVTGLAINELWFGERYAELMQKQGDAQKVRASAEKALAKNPKDDLAIIQLGFALKAMGKVEEGKKTIERLPYAKADGRELPATRMLFAFP